MPEDEKTTMASQAENAEEKAEEKDAEAKAEESRARARQRSKARRASRAEQKARAGSKAGKGGDGAGDRTVIHLSKKVQIVCGVVAAVVVLAIGFNAWHETPGFCVQICHQPMSENYLETLQVDPHDAGVDKWGNDVAESRGMLASIHGNVGKSCMDCHVPSIEEQVTEGLEWIRGDYYNPLSERDLARLVYYRGATQTEFCMNDTCHNYTTDDLTAKTSWMSRNPHSWHHSEYTCSDCHKAHRASVMRCSQCHDDYYLPEGWITWQESQELPTQYMSYETEQILEADD